MATRRIPGTTVYLEPGLRSRVEGEVAADHGSTFSYWINKLTAIGYEQLKREREAKHGARGRGRKQFQTN